MELYEFNLLELNRRAEYLWAAGAFIINIKQKSYSYNLYSLNGYFVEVKLSKENKIIAITPFRQGGLLNKYLDYIDVTKL